MVSWTPGPAVVVLLVAIAICNLESVEATVRTLTALGDQPDDVGAPAVVPPESPTSLAPSAPLAQAMRKIKAPGGGQTWCKVLPSPFVVLCDAAPAVCSSYQLPCQTDTTLACNNGTSFCKQPGGFTWYVHSRQAGGIPECRCAQLCAAILQGRHGPDAACTSYPKAVATLQSAGQLPQQEPTGPRAAAAYFMFVPPVDEQPATAAPATAAAAGSPDSPTAAGDDGGQPQLAAGEAAPAEDDGSSDSDGDTPDTPGGEGGGATPPPAASASSGIIVCLPDLSTQGAPKGPRHRPPKNNKGG